MESLTAGLTLAGRFRLVRRLGQGAVGEVWLAEDATARCQVALKIAAAGADPALLRAEFEQARRLVHPGIVRLQEYSEGPPAFLVMQFVRGAGIGALRGQGFRAIIETLIPVADALEHAHRQSVVHRDLKSSNVLRDEHGRIFISDFGLGAASRGGSLPGMSPQQLDGAPPAVSDDVYAFGALLYDLLAGQPLFHPDVTPERIRGEVPEIPASDLTGEPLPEGLRRLMTGLLQKSPAARPPGMGAVRSALEDILRDSAPRAGDAELIRPVARSRAAEVDDAGATREAMPGTRARSGLPALAVYGGLALCLVLALAVMLYLPAVVRERAPKPGAAAPSPPEPVPAAAPVAPEAPAVPQEVLDQVLGEFLRSDDELRKINADQWGGADWAELRRLAQSGDEAYQRHDGTAAISAYRAAAALARQLLARAPEVLAAALREGEAALHAGDQARAVAQFETALAVSPGDPRARHGQERARKLDRLLPLMSEASAAESAGRRSEALDLYRKAAALDPEWAPAAAGVARLSRAAAVDAYETEMARGFSAQASGDSQRARSAFDAALKLRPGDAQAQAAIVQLDTDQKLARLTALQTEARALEKAERWSEALQRYEAALAVDANLADARQGQERARSRLDLDQRLRRQLGNADRFNDDAVLAQAREVLAAARAVEAPGPVLSQQIAELDRLLAVAMTPVSVTLESDNMTEVTLYKIGRLGVFSTRTLELRPGAYTAVGSRQGYRDVRRTFRVAPGSAAPVVVRCEEPI